MNYLNEVMSQRRTAWVPKMLLVMPVMLLGSTQVAAQSRAVAVVPNTVAGYVYVPYEEGAESNAETDATIHIMKEGTYTDYVVTSEPRGVRCDQDALICDATLKAGELYTLKVHGQYIEGKELFVLPDWSQGCIKEASIECSTAIQEDMTIKITAQPLFGSGLVPVGVGEGAKAYYVGMQGMDYVVAALDQTISAPWGTGSGGTATDRNNGYQNTQIIQGSEHVAQCKTHLPSQGFGSDWYWPAINELSSLPSSAEITKKISGGSKLYLWSSTEGYYYKIYKNSVKSGSRNSDSYNSFCIKKF